MSSLALRVVESHARAYRHTWQGSVYSTFLSPLLFLGAMGFGLGGLVDRGGSPLPGGSYLDFLAPGLLAASAMQIAASEASYPVMAGLRWQGTYRAALATPLRPADLVLGQLVWVGVRLCMSTSAFVLVMLLFGAGRTPRVLIALIVAILVGLASAAPVTAFTGTLNSDYPLAGLFRFVLVPLFLLSGAFFPISELPSWVLPLAYATPAWHGVELARSATIGTAPALPVLAHLSVIAAWFTAGTAAAIVIFEHRLRT